LGITENVYLCDTFTGVVKAGEYDYHYNNGEHSTPINSVDALIKEQNLQYVKILQGIFPDESSHKILEQQIRFCHIDVDVYKSAEDIVAWVWGKLVVGGMIVFDDYGFETCQGIRKYVDEISLQKDNLMIYNTNGHAIIIKI
jgi:O-methyltransferase